MDKKPLPIGIEDFKILKEEKYYFVDKSLFIKEFLDQKGSVNLFLRPRRFGKTLSLSMLKYYFEKPINSEADNSSLFGDTMIWIAGKKYIKEFAKYPVISMSLKNAAQLSFEEMYKGFQKIISKEYERHSYLLKSNKLDAQNKKDFCKIKNLETNDKMDFKISLLKLTDLLYQHYNQRVVIIIDEYDAPLQKAFVNGFYKEAIDFVSSFLGNGMKTNEHMQFGIMTGYMRIFEESIFTGFNNLIVNSILTPNYSEMFGFTQNEVDEMLDYYEIYHKRDLIKEWYNGYRFSKTWLYNPWSLINYVKVLNMDLSSFPIPYWGNTSGNDLIKDLIRGSDGKTKDILRKLLQGETIQLILNDGIIYDDLRIPSEDKILNMFFFSGYLTQKSVKFLNNRNVYEICIPNEEVKQIYEGIIDDWFQEKVQALNNEDFYRRVLSGDAEYFDKKINDILSSTMSYYDFKEDFYYGFTAGLFQSLDGYQVLSNRESGNGRYDLALIPKRGVSQPVVIMELKYLPQEKGYLSEKVASEAISQIENIDYIKSLQQKGYKIIVKYGITFVAKGCSIRVKI